MLKYSRSCNKIEQNLFGVTVCLAVGVCLKLFTQSAINMDGIVWMYRYYIVHMLNTLSDGCIKITY